MLEVESCDLPDTGRHVDFLIGHGCKDILQMTYSLGNCQAEPGQVPS